MEISTRPEFAVGSFEAADRDAFTGVVVDDRVLPLSRTPIADRSLFGDWDSLVGELSTWLPQAGDSLDASLPIETLRVRPPVTAGQVFQCGANYRTHVIDLIVAQEVGRRPGEDLEALRARAAKSVDERAASGRPYVFVGLPSSICGPHDDVILPRRGVAHDWELELGVVIGRPARDVQRSEALDYVAGYTVVNDLTTRDLVFRPDVPGIGTDWLASKNAPTFSPVGPFLTPAAFVDPSDLRIVLRLNGEVMQDGKTSDMVFDVARLIEYVSSITELRPGDLLMTGSPAGNGAHYGRYLRPGDVLEGEITGLGSQRNRCVAAA